jgi:transcriptional regulator with XRE-family HTH domain
MPKKQSRKATEIDRLIGRRIRLRRSEKGWSQADLAKQLGIAFQQVQKYENGTNRISAGRLYELAAELGVPVTYFYEECVKLPEGQAYPETLDLSDPFIYSIVLSLLKLDQEDRQAVKSLILRLTQSKK